MKLEAQPIGFWGFNRSLKLNDQPWGDCKGRSWKGGLEIALADGRRFLLQKEHWFGNQLNLIDQKDRRILGKAFLKNVFRRTWELKLSFGSVELKPQGWLSAGYQVTQGSRNLAVLERTGFFKAGWILQDNGTLSETDLLLIGLIFETMRRRAAAAAAA